MFSNVISLFIISFIGFIDFVGIGLVYPMFSSMLYQDNNIFLSPDISDTMRGATLGLLLALMPITQFFCAPILGMLSDQYGRKKILIPCLLAGLAGYLIAVQAIISGSLILLLASRVAVGVAGATVAVIQAALADISTQEEKAKNFGVFNMALGLGFTMGPLLGGFSSELDFGYFSGFSVAFLGAAGMILINLLLIVFFFKEAYVPKMAKELSLVQGIANIRKAFVSKELRDVFSCVFFACVGWSFYWEFTPVTWIVDYGFDSAAIGRWYAYGAIIYALSCGVLIRPIVSRFSNLYVLFYALVACSFSIGILSIFTEVFWLWVYIPLQQFTIALFWPTAAAAISNASSEDHQGEALGIFQSVESLAFAISPLIAGPFLGLGAMMPIVIGSGTMLFGAVILGLSLYRKPCFVPENVKEEKIF